MFAQLEPEMRKTSLLFAILLLIAALPLSARAATSQDSPAVVHAALFWINGCPHCAEVMTDTLPHIKGKYATQLNLLAIELVTSQDIDALYDLGASLGLSKDEIGVPFILVDRTVLVGVNDITNQLPGLVEKYISAGGVEFPDLPVLAEMLTKGIPYTSTEPGVQLVAQPASTQASGMTLGWIIMGLMAIALVVAIVAISRAFQGKPLGEIKGWVNLVIPILSLIGLGASIYLTYIEITHARAVCGPVGDCNAVQSSPYARLFGFLPVGLLGAIGYVTILATWLWRRYRRDMLARIAGPALFGMALFGTLFSIYLTYLELFVIHAVCIWCLSSAVIITALMLLNLPPITQWLAIADDEE